MDPESSLDAVRQIGITDGRIVKISEAPLAGKQTIDASGLIVAPGFIDLHAHGQDNKANKYQAVISFGASSSHARNRVLVMSSGNREPGLLSDDDWEN